MKKLIYILFFCLVACGGSNSNDTLQAPLLAYPTNSLLCTENTINFQWNAPATLLDDELTYTLEITTDNTFANIDYSFTSTATSYTIELEKSTAYYWRVKATNNNTTSSYSEVFNFYTQGEDVTNYAPFAPSLISPAIDTEVSTGTVNLEWNASDADNDPLTFNVYYGTSNPPNTLIAENITSYNFNVTAEPQTNYYWKVVVKDSKNATTIGQVWSFYTN